MRDSAGVEAVTIRLPAPSQALRWELTRGPLVSVGDVEGDEAHVFEHVPVALLGPDGGLVVLNRGVGPAVREFDSRGALVRIVGEHGEGPGEFEDPSGVFRYPGDSLAVWDRRSSRITLFSREGDYGRTIRVSAAGNVPLLSVVGSLPDGGFLGMRDGFFLSRPNRRKGWEMTNVLRIDPTGGKADPLGEFPLVETARNARGYATPREFGGRGSLLAAPTGFAWGRTDIGEVRFYKVDGEFTRVVRLEGDRADITGEVWNRYVDVVERRLAIPRGGVGLRGPARIIESRPRASVAPLLSKWVAVDERFLWIRALAFPWEPEPPLMRIDAETGNAVVLQLPGEALVKEIRGGCLVLTRASDLDVVRVEVYGILAVTDDRRTPSHLERTEGAGAATERMR